METFLLLILGFFVAGVIWKLIWRAVFISVIQEDFPNITYQKVNKFCKVLRSGKQTEILAESAKLFGIHYRYVSVIIYTKLIKESW